MDPIEENIVTYPRYDSDDDDPIGDGGQNIYDPYDPENNGIECDEESF